MARSTSSSSSSSTSAAAATTEASSATTNDSNSVGQSIALKIRTLDQKTYPIVISSDASVPQLKEAVASETGVVLARQRLIFRGKVLKNDQNISAYALEDGHVLHLVVRAEEAVAAEVRQTRGQQQSLQGGRAGSSTDPRNNDEPDPTVGASPRSRVVMGATIAVPDDMPMPFLSSMIANFVNSMGSAAVAGTGGAAVGGAQADDFGPQRHREVLRRLRRSRQGAVNGSAGGDAPGSSPSTTRRRGRHGGDGAATSSISPSSLSGNMLRDSAENQLRRLSSSLSSSAFDLPELQPRADEHGDANLNRDEALIEEQLRQLMAHVQQFTPRMERLPQALREIGWHGRHDQEAPNALVSSTVRAIDSLQSVGESASAIARFARHVFLNNSPDIPSPLVRIDDRGLLRASLSFPISVPQPPPGGAQRRRSQTQRGVDATAATATEDGNPGVLRSIYQRVTSGLLGGRDVADQAASAASGRSRETTTNSTAPTDEAAGTGQPSNGEVNRFTISALSGPFHPIFPLSFTGGAIFPPPDATPRPEWDVIALWERLSRDLRAGTAFGILRGDAQSLFDLMRSLATIFISGAYTPQLTSTPIRVWARRFLIAVRRALQEQTLPVELLALTPDRDGARLVEELTRPLDPFMPELIDHIRRANTASQGDVFARSCIGFLKNLSSQFLTRAREYAGGDSARMIWLLEAVLVAMGIEQGLSSYVVAQFIEFASPGDRLRRPRDSNSDATTEPAVKRHRTE